MRAYKICEVIKDIAYSMFNDNQHRLRYEFDIPTHPPVGWGPLSAFDAIDPAIAFLEKFHDIKSLDFRLFECDVVVDVHENYYARDLWCIGEHSKMNLYRERIPTGTILCKEITLRDEIPVKEVIYQENGISHWKLAVSQSV